MKKILLLILTICFVFACVGCSSDDVSGSVENDNVSNGGNSGSSQSSDLLTYFDSDIVAAITECPYISSFVLTTDLVDEDCDRKPIAVLFFTVDSLDGNETGDDYYEKVNSGGCIEIFEDAAAAQGRNYYLTGFFLFGLTGGDHEVIDRYVIQTSKKLSNQEQKDIVDALSNILNKQTEDPSQNENMAGAPDIWTNLLEKHYEEVKKQFEEAGFTNITCVAHEIDYDENHVFEGSVVNIAIGEDGDICTFEKGEQWAKDIKIRIDYRVKPVIEESADSSETIPETPTDSNPYNAVGYYSIRTKTEYAHVDSDVIRLGNKERVWITIEASPATLTMDDFIVDYDDAMLEIVDVVSTTVGDTLRIEIAVKAKSSGVSEIIICSGYELYEDGENATAYILTVNGLTSSDGKVVYVTSTGEKYHLSASCVESGIKTTLSDALAYEYKPCGKCAK